MNEVDAARFFKASGAKVAVPMHVGMFDEKTPDIFKAEPRVLPEIYKEIAL
jgi:L-ascorbate metabolism protein UlaG (beta-lactamase superfamily)